MLGRSQLQQALAALAAQLQAKGKPRALVVIGGSGLIALGLIERTTRDVDVDQGPGRHLDDLQALKASRDELIAAARWAQTHDPSVGFRAELLRVLTHLGVGDADI
jgi:purine nucleoside phosphorylase